MAPKLSPLFISLALFLAPPCLARDVPDNLKSLYKSLTDKSSECENGLETGFYSSDTSTDEWTYCGDRMDEDGIIYITGPAGKLTNMDVDCDGVSNRTTEDGRCGSSTDTQSITAFQEEFEEYGTGLGDLDAQAHPYVVFGNLGSDFVEYDPQWDDVEPLSIIAVVCGDKLIYGVWGDYNGDDGDKPLVGEASISLATLCYGDKMSGGNGHDEDDVLYIAFQGEDAVPGADGADWTSGDPKVFEESLAELGDRLVAGIASAAPGGWACATVGNAMLVAFGVGLGVW